MAETISGYSARLYQALNGVDQEKANQLSELVQDKINSACTITLLGNGGSQANAHHIVGDYLKSFSILRKSIRISCFGDNACYLTAVSNDIDYSEAYSLLAGSSIQQDDLIIYLSGSGNSMNLVKCAKAARSKGVKQVAVTAFNGGELKELVDLHIHIPTFDMEIAEDCQLAVFHNLKQNLLIRMSTDDKDGHNILMTKYQKRTIEDLVS